MAGRKSDQDNVNPGQFSAPNDDNSADPHLHNAQKSEYKQTLTDEHESMIPRRGENPALADLRARREAARAAQADAVPDDSARASDAGSTE